MVLESIITPQDAERSPWKITLLAIAFAFIAAYAALYSGLPSKGLVAVAVASMASIPFIAGLFGYGESWYEEEKLLGSRTLARHFPVLIVLGAFFAGLLLGFTAVQFTMTPSEAAGTFDIQINEVKAVSQAFTGAATEYDAAVAAFEIIFFHNLQVLALIITVSVLWGAGAVIILVWNASVLGVFLGAVSARARGAGEGALAGVSLGILGILPHGSFELAAYLTGALAGGILSAAIVRRKTLQDGFILVLYDSARLFALAVFFIALGAAIESQAFAAG